ncbi:MAG: GLUG motif-containing protein [Phycisphaerae bacterium]
MAGVSKRQWAISLFLMMLYFYGIPAMAQYGGGTGELNDPYQIATAEDLMLLGESPEDYDRQFILTADIDLDPSLPGRKVFDKAIIAPDTNNAKDGFQGTPFTGVFVGNGHTVSNLTIQGRSYLGLLGQLESGAEIKDLGVVDVNITGSETYIGGLMGRSCGIITDCYTSGSVSGRLYVGGLVGVNFLGQVLNCYSTVSASGENDVGGLLGCNYGGNVLNCYSTGSARGEYYVGGLVGCNYGNVLNCYSTGSASGDHDVGGLVGRNGYRYLAGYVYGNVLNCCYSTGSVSGDHDVGGLVGVNSSGQVLNCYSTGSARGDHGVGGLVGWNNNGEVTSCYSAGPVNGGNISGGLVGTGDSGRVNNSVWDVETSGLMNSRGGAGLTTAEMMDPDMLGLNGLGGDPNWVLDSGRDYPRLAWEERPGLIIPQPVIDWLAGTGTPEDPFQIRSADQILLLHKSSLLWDKHFVLNADIDLDPSLPGRIVFRRAVIPTFKGSFVGNGHAILNLQIEGVDRLGFFGTLSKGSLVRSLGLENVLVHGTGSGIGGLVGYMNYNSSGQVLNCYSTGSASGENHVGGLVGAIWTTNVEVINCYSTGRVSGNEDVGGLVGEISTFGSPNFPEDIRDIVINCYSTVTVSGNEDVGGLVGRVHRFGTLGLSKAASYYSTATVSGNEDVGRLVGGGGWEGVSVTSYFWDIQTSGQATSAGGTGKTTAEMQTASTFLEAGWDFVDETENGTEDIWWILEGQDYPRLWWELSD